jgi:trigger factor
MIEGFEQGLLGASAGEQRSVEATFPDDYKARHLAGKTAVFDIVVDAVAEAVLPEVAEAFARAMGVEEGSVETLIRDIRENMQRDMDARLKSMTKERVMDLLLDTHQFEVPRAVIDEEASRLREDTNRQMQGQGQSSSSFQLPVEIFREQAERRVKLGMLVSKIISEQHIEVDEQRLRQTIEDFAASYESPGEMIEWYYEQSERLEPVKRIVLEDQVVDWVLGQIKVKEQPQTFEQLTAA